MKRAFLTLGAALLALTGCASQRGYTVSWLYSESITKRLDAHWFMRELHDSRGTAAVELMYCPSVPDQPTTCRTSTVWVREGRSLLDHPRLGPAPQPLPK